MDLSLIIEWYLNNIGYGTIFLLMMVESSFIPFPSEVVVPPAAYMAAQGGGINGALVLVFATLGALSGAFINYFLAYFLGRPLVHAFARSRVGHLFMLSEEKVMKAEAFFEKKGVVSTFMGRLMPAIRQLVSIPAGLSRMHLGKFSFFTILGAGTWNLVLYYLGWQVAHIEGVRTKQELIQLVSEHSHTIGVWILIVFHCFILPFAFYKIIKRRRAKKREKNSEDK